MHAIIGDDVTAAQRYPCCDFDDLARLYEEYQLYEVLHDYFPHLKDGWFDQRQRYLPPPDSGRNHIR